MKKWIKYFIYCLYIINCLKPCKDVRTWPSAFTVVSIVSIDRKLLSWKKQTHNFVTEYGWKHTPYWHSTNIIPMHCKIQLLFSNINPFCQTTKWSIMSLFKRKEKKKEKNPHTSARKGAKCPNSLFIVWPRRSEKNKSHWISLQNTFLSPLLYYSYIILFHRQRIIIIHLGTAKRCYYFEVFSS